MHASTLSLATSIPTTTRSFCAIIQLPSLLGSGSKPMQLFGLRKTPDLSHAPRQALKAFEHARAQVQRRAVLREPPVRTFWQILRTQEHVISRKAIAQGMSDCLRCPVCSCAHFSCTLHTRPRVQRASGIPCALFIFEGGKFPAKLARNPRRDREFMFSRRCEPPGRANARPMAGS